MEEGIEEPEGTEEPRIRWRAEEEAPSADAFEEEPGDEAPSPPTVRWREEPDEEREPTVTFGAPSPAYDEEEPEDVLDEEPYADEYEEANAEEDYDEPYVDEEYEDDEETEEKKIAAVAPPQGPEAPAGRTHHVQRGPNRVAQEQAGPGVSIGLVAAGAVVVVLAALGWWLLTQQPGPADSAAPVATEQQPAQQPPAATVPGEDPAETEAPPAGNAEPETPSAGETETPSTAQTDPLRGGSIDVSAGGYAIVVTSTPSAATAGAVADRYAAQGYRSGVLTPEVVRGTTYHRVGVGQFETLEQATAARQELAGDELPGDAWITAIR